MGFVNDKYFKITGRIRVEGQKGYRNFWSIKGDGNFTWLLQSFGNYALMTMDDMLVAPKVFKNVSPGKDLKIEGGFVLEALDNKFRYAWDGEIMEPLPIPWDIELDAGGSGGKRLLILVGRSREAHALKGLGLEFKALQVENPPGFAQWR